MLAYTHVDIAGALITLRFASPEDTILHKLVWYRLGDEVSERQWNDALGVLRIQGAALDLSYLQRWAEPLGVLGLFTHALRATNDPSL